MQKCKSTSHGIAAADVLLEKKKYLKPKNWSRDQVSKENIRFCEICGQICIF